jgi:hypothetical protein
MSNNAKNRRKQEVFSLWAILFYVFDPDFDPNGERRGKGWEGLFIRDPTLKDGKPGRLTSS